MKNTDQTYVDMVKEIGEDKFKARLKELNKSADKFIKEAGYSESVRCNERILAHVLLDYYADISRLKDFHEIELIRTEKIFAYTIAWIIKRKPLQFFDANEKDIYVNERFAAYLMINECLHCGEKNIAPSDQTYLNEYIDLIFYYLKYRECNPQVLELAMESFKMGTKVIKSMPKRTCKLFAQDSQSEQCEEITVGEKILPDDIPIAAIECDYREDAVGELSSEKETEYKEILKNIKR